MIPEHMSLEWALYVVLFGFLFGCGFAVASYVMARVFTRAAPTRAV